MELFDLPGKVAVVTGGNGGIGLGYARGLARAGCAVAVWGRNEEKNEAAVAELEALGADAAGFACDVSSEDQVHTAMAASLDRFGHVDAVFANAGTSTRNTRFIDISVAEWREVFAVNAEGVFLTFRAAARHMVERDQGGSLVVTSSVASRMGMPRGEHYAATKAGVLAIARSIAVEFGRHGIRANAVVPGWIETDMTADYLSDERFARAVLPRIPRRRWGAPADFEGIAVYLVSDASSWHTGDVITIDGGYSVF